MTTAKTKGYTIQIVSMSKIDYWKGRVDAIPGTSMEDVDIHGTIWKVIRGPKHNWSNADTVFKDRTYKTDNDAFTAVLEYTTKWVQPSFQAFVKLGKDSNER